MEGAILIDNLEEIESIVSDFKMQNLDHRKKVVEFYNEYVRKDYERKERYNCSGCVIKCFKRIKVYLA